MEHSKESGILPLPLNLKLQNGNQMAVHAALLWGTDHLVLVDTGVPGQLDVIREGLEQAGFSLDQLTHVIITHQDRDHIGSLPELIRAKEGKLEVLAHEEGIPYLAGEIPLIKGRCLRRVGESQYGASRGRFAIWRRITSRVHPRTHA